MKKLILMLMLIFSINVKAAPLYSAEVYQCNKTLLKLCNEVAISEQDLVRCISGANDVCALTAECLHRNKLLNEKNWEKQVELIMNCLDEYEKNNNRSNGNSLRLL